MNLNEIDCAIDEACSEFEQAGYTAWSAVKCLINATKTLRANTTLSQINDNSTQPRKPFDLEAAKNGAKVVTRDGKKVRVICFDAMNDIHQLVALVTSGGIETAVATGADGRLMAGCDSDLDLFMAPVKKECWINFYGISYRDTHVYASKALADSAAIRATADRVSCIHHTWEE